MARQPRRLLKRPARDWPAPGLYDFNELMKLWFPMVRKEARPMTNLTFGQALELAQQGHRISRAGWNGKGMWVAYSPGAVGLPADKFWSPANRAFAAANGGSADVLPCLTMKTADGKILMGWLASQSDMLALDWNAAPIDYPLGVTP